MEKWALDRFKEAGADAVKRGTDGEPDREVFWGDGRHFWVEFKKPGRDPEDLRPSQKVWLKYKKPTRDEFYKVDTKQQVLDILLDWSLRYGPATALAR